jgi:hypothetical protein
MQDLSHVWGTWKPYEISVHKVNECVAIESFFGHDPLTTFPADIGREDRIEEVEAHQEG